MSRNQKSSGTLKPRNPVARSPLLRKGGAHQTSPSAKRQQSRDALRDEAQDWREELEEQELPAEPDQE